ncbi:hypothetical protein, partial [Microbispora sp. ATCC PTA-5024]|uniref:hypothetical protein n=1 Tax=Microbispora sp. ATCC PTA-5024 TaxID=316330 RepID=UPI000560E7DB
VAAAVAALAASVALDGWAGVAAACGAYVVLFAALSVAGLIRSELVHNRVTSAQRATVMSVDSLQLQFGGLLSALFLVPLAGAAGPGVAWAVTAAVVVASSLLFVRLPPPKAAVRAQEAALSHPQ